MNYLIAFIVSFIFIALKATQQMNVIHYHFKAVMPVSMGLAICEVSIITLVVRDSLWLAIPLGIGGGLGCLIVMWLHKKAGVK